MRPLLSFVLGVVALVLTAAATPALWLERTVVDEGGYVALVDPLGRDPELQDALAATLVDEVLTRSEVSEVAAAAARPVLTQVAQGLTRLPSYPDAWTETNRRSHAAVFDPQAGDEVTIDLAPIGRLLVDEGAGQLTVDVPAPPTVPVVVGGERERAAVDDVAALDPRAFYLLGGAVLAALLCIAAARRRGAVVLWLGLGAVAIAGVLKLAVVVALPVLVASVQPPSDLGEEVVDLLADAAAASFDGWLLALAGLGVVLLVLGVIMRVIGRRHEAPA